MSKQRRCLVCGNALEKSKRGGPAVFCTWSDCAVSGKYIHRDVFDAFTAELEELRDRIGDPDLHCDGCHDDQCDGKPFPLGDRYSG